MNFIVEQNEIHTWKNQITTSKNQNLVKFLALFFGPNQVIWPTVWPIVAAIYYTILSIWLYDRRSRLKQLFEDTNTQSSVVPKMHG